MASVSNKLIDVGHENIILRTFILLVQSAHTVLKYADTQFYRQPGLSAIKFIVLNGLAFHGGSMRPYEIADWTYRERHNITTLVDRLKKGGLVQTVRSNTDKRFISVVLTEKGWEALNKALPVAKEIVNQVMSSISKDDIALLALCNPGVMLLTLPLAPEVSMTAKTFAA